MNCNHDKPVYGHCIFVLCPNYRGSCPKHNLAPVGRAACTLDVPQNQVEAVLNVIAPYVDGPEGFQPVRWPIFRFDVDGQMVIPSDEQLLALAQSVVTAIRTVS